MATINLGRIKPVWQGLWAASTAYVKDDIVRYDVDSYICTASHTSSADFASDSANWDLVAQGATIPSQTGKANYTLMTDGTELVWTDTSTFTTLWAGSNNYGITVNLSDSMNNYKTIWFEGLSYENIFSIPVEVLRNNQYGTSGSGHMLAGYDAEHTYVKWINDTQIYITLGSHGLHHIWGQK